MNRNKFVDFINQFYSQNVSQSAGYTELSSEKLEGISLKIDHLVDDVVNGKVETVILTGNAGDGKTYICSQLYEKLIGKRLPIKKIIEEKTAQGWTLNMVKDASEVPAAELEKFLADMESTLCPALDNNCIFILAGNEGKLSEVFDSFALPRLQELLNEALRPEFVDEISSTKKQGSEWASVKVLNFNWRDLTEENAFKSIVKAFVEDTRKWETACHKCDLKDDCPIFLNARLLRNDEIIGRIRTLFKFFRCIEGHFTLREIFSAISYILTAGLNCMAIKDVKEKHRQLSYMFYNNIFSRHNLGAEDFPKPMDRVLRGLQKFDVATAPLAKVNKGVVSGIEKLKNFQTPKQSEQSDLLFFKFDLEEPRECSVLDAFKRRVYFFNKKIFWGDINLSDISKIIDIDHHDYLPFSSFREFDTFISSEIEVGSVEYENIKKTIIMGLNLLANRDDDTADFWLKVYKPSGNQAQILELFGDIVETIDIQLSTQSPVYDANYIEFANTEFYFSVRVENHQAPALRLPITIEIYEGLWAAARGNQSKQGFGYLDRVIKEFRESLYYRILEKTGSRKFILNAHFKDNNDNKDNKDNKGAVEVFTEKDRVMMRRRR
ncbi:MAG: hypothetical protein MUF15_21825 [Acidobacteria bacterium]|jgi:hypothetical protein|nr:hypothetical protein [Acidobacteriota bacterium]